MSDKTNPDRSTDPSTGLSTGRTLPSLALTRAGGNTKPAPASVYLLADHLDTVLAAAEDIVNARLTWNSARRADQREISQEKHSFRDDIEDIRKLENTIIIRVLTSRERAEDVARDDKRFRQLAKLYVAGTAVLLDAVQECGDSTDSDFATADAIPAYLRSRGLVDPDAPAPDIGENLQVGEDFLIAKRIAAGPLMDLAAALLDALELHYDLFLDENELAMAPQINRFEDDTVSAAPTGDGQMHVGQTRDSQTHDSKPHNNELAAAIEDVREDASQKQADTAKQSDTLHPDIWNKMSTAGSVIAPVISPPAPEPLVVVSKIEAVEDTIEEIAPSGAIDDVSEDDVITEIVSTTDAVARDDSDTPDHVADGDGEGDPVTLDATDAAADADHEEPIAIADDETGLIDATSSDEQSDGATARDEISLDATTMDVRASDVESQDSSPNDALDDSVIITAANDDDTSASDDAAEFSDGDEDKISLIADNMDADPDAVQADSPETQDAVTDVALDTAADTSDAEAEREHDDIEAAAENGADDDTSDEDEDKRKSSKSLVGRLSVIKP